MNPSGSSRSSPYKRPRVQSTATRPAYSDLYSSSMMVRPASKSISTISCALTETVRTAGVRAPRSDSLGMVFAFLPIRL